jgi:hypothetical protein
MTYRMSDHNPYAPPREVSEPATLRQPLTREQVKRRMSVPAYGILASVGLNALMLAWGAFVVWIDLTRGAAVDLQGAVWIGIYLLATCATNWAAARGAFAMLQLRDYRTALRGAWFAIVPCNVGCVMALPFAIYADWLLRNPEVHAHFAAGKNRLRPAQPDGLE